VQNASSIGHVATCSKLPSTCSFLILTLEVLVDF
jgi:hypothetical protein